LLGSRWNPKKPDDIKIVTKQYATFTENYFKGIETIKELYWEALRAPDNQDNLRANPYMREYFLKKRFGKTKEERVAEVKKVNQMYAEHVRTVDARLEEEAKLGIGTARENLEHKRENARIRRRLGFFDMEIDADGNEIQAEEGHGVEDEEADKFRITSARHEQAIKDNTERQKVDIVTPITGISKN